MTRAEDELQLTRELNQRIIEAMPGGIVHVGIDGAIRTANKEALRILGMSFNAIAKKYTADFDTETLWQD